MLQEVALWRTTGNPLRPRRHKGSSVLTVAGPRNHHYRQQPVLEPLPPPAAVNIEPKSPTICSALQ